MSRMQRLRGLMRKEWLQIRRDPSSIAIAFVMPLILLLLFGYAVSLDARRVPIALVVERPSAATEDFTGAFADSPWIAPRPIADMPTAEQALLEGKVDAVVRLQADFAARMLGNGQPAPFQVIANGVDANTARITLGYIEGIWRQWLEDRALARGLEPALPIRLEPRIWFNPNSRSRDYIVPGLIAVIMTLIGALLAAMVVAREWERGTLEPLLVTPVTLGEVLLGKLVPYFILGMGGLTLSVAMALGLFAVPLRGSLAVLCAVSALFMLVALGMGLLISVLARNQFVAGQVALIVTFLPAFLLSGMIFDINSMGPVVQTLTYLIPARYFVSFLHTVFLAGNVWPVILLNTAALAVIAALLLVSVRLRSRKRLD
ncbi:MAG: ABC transporter permease [Candidatus Competibacterales bacterium]|nr:ABC transporter permease [Candidatus Competibacterales bacterium]